jgi:hypothetical protein
MHWHVGCSLWVLLRSFSFLVKVLAKTGYTFFVFYISFEVWRGCKRVLLFLTWIEKKIKKNKCIWTRYITRASPQFV